MRTKWTRQAVSSLQAVLDFCATQSPQRENRTRTIIFFKTQLLEEYPLMGPIEPFLARLQPTTEYRFVMAGFYKIVYRVAVDTVWICHVFDSRSDPSRLATVSPT